MDLGVGNYAKVNKNKLYYALYSKYEEMMDDENDHEFRGEMVIYTHMKRHIIHRLHLKMVSK